MAAKKTRHEYSAGSVTILDWPECVRRRPCRYVSTDERGVGYLIRSAYT